MATFGMVEYGKSNIHGPKYTDQNNRFTGNAWVRQSADGKLHINTTNKSDNINVQREGGWINVDINKQSHRYRADQISGIQLNTHGGNDRVTIGRGIGVPIATNTGRGVDKVKNYNDGTKINTGGGWEGRFDQVKNRSNFTDIRSQGNVNTAGTFNRVRGARNVNSRGAYNDIGLNQFGGNARVRGYGNVVNGGAYGWNNIGVVGHGNVANARWGSASARGYGNFVSGAHTNNNGWRGWGGFNPHFGGWHGFFARAFMT